MLNFNPELIRPDQRAALAAWREDHARAKRALWLDYVKVFFCCCVISWIVAIDYALLVEFGTYFLSDSGQAGLNEYLVALIGVVMLATVHGILLWVLPTPRIGSSWATAILVCVGIFLIPMGLFVGLMFYTAGAGSLVGSDAAATQIAEFLGETVRTKAPSLVEFFENTIRPSLGIILVVAFAPIFVISLIGAHVFLVAIDQSLKHIGETRSRAIQGDRLFARLRDSESAYDSLYRKLEAKVSESAPDRYRRYADRIATTVADAQRPAERVLAARKLVPFDTDNEIDAIFATKAGLSPVLRALELEELERRVAAIRSSGSVENILATVQPTQEHEK